VKKFNRLLALIFITNISFGQIQIDDAPMFVEVERISFQWHPAGIKNTSA